MEPEKNPTPEDTHSKKPAPPSEAEVRLPTREYEELLARLKELEEMKDRFLRSAADFDNAKKRLARERDEFVKFSQETLIRHLLPILDNFERALAHARSVPSPLLGPSAKNLGGSASGGEGRGLPAGQAGKGEGVLAGIQLVFKQLTDILKKEGLTRVKTLGERVDPHRHEVVSYVPEKGPEDVIVEEVEAGYLLHDRLLRAAKVCVRVSPSSPRVQKGSEKEEEKEEPIT